MKTPLHATFKIKCVRFCTFLQVEAGYKANYGDKMHPLLPSIVLTHITHRHYSNFIHFSQSAHRTLHDDEGCYNSNEIISMYPIHHSSSK